MTSLPVALLLAAGFLAPIAIVAIYSIMPARTFVLTGSVTPENYVAAFTEGYWRPLMWSVSGALLTTILCLLLAWPTAKALKSLEGYRATFVTILIALPIFISESVRLFGFSLFLMPAGGILAGTMDAAFDVSIGSILNTRTAALLGMVYVHFPFVLFPLLLGLSQIPEEQREAARDLGASNWQLMREIDAPLAAPGALIGALFCFVLALGANAEMRILGGQSVTVITHAIEQRFNYAQDWPMGAALTMLVIAITALLVLPVFRRIDIDRLIRR
ncbi:MAG: ABC transporter permease subunit [Gammaproteobacteria bacterium]|nr:ABC transporter permease subunit [Gammaproteobacteria bacterium]